MSSNNGTTIVDFRNNGLGTCGQIFPGTNISSMGSQSYTAGTSLFQQTNWETQLSVDADTVNESSVAGTYTHTQTLSGSQPGTVAGTVNVQIIESYEKRGINPIGSYNPLNGDSKMRLWFGKEKRTKTTIKG